MTEPRRVFVPKPYQNLIIDHTLEHERCAVWADPGLGKTCCALTAIDALQMAGETKPALILAPLRVARDTWKDEVAKWSHLSSMDIMPIVGTAAERTLALRHDVAVATCNYENLPWLVDYWGERWPYATVVLDEASKVKAFRGGFRTSTAGKVYLQVDRKTRAGAFATVAWDKVKRLIELTGTPASNGLDNLWGQLWYIDRGQRLGRTHESFRKRWFQRGYDGYSIEALPHAQKDIQGQLKDVCITIDAKDWFDLKEPIVNDVYIDLPVKARALYKDMEKKLFIELEGGGTKEAFNAAAKTNACLQIANGAVYVDPDAESDNHPRAKEWKAIHDEKLEALDEYLEEVGGAPTIVVYTFRSDLARIKKKFPHALTLGVAKELDEFKKGKSAIGLAHQASLGHGVDGLQYACNRIVFFGADWDLETYLQMLARIGPVRQAQAGLDRPVFVTHIVARHTMDELVMERRESKKSVQSILLAAMKRRK